MEPAAPHLPSPRITTKAVSPQRGTSSGNVGMDVLGRLPDKSESRALEIALARAAAHRNAAQRKQERGNVFALTQAAIGREIAGLREEVRKTSSELAVTPQPKQQFASVVSSHYETPSTPGTVQKTSTPVVDHEMEQEVVRLKKVEVLYTTQTAVLRDLESRLEGYTTTLMSNEKEIALSRHDLTECKAASIEMLADRFKILSDQHKSLKSQLLEHGWTQTPKTDSAQQADSSIQLIQSSADVDISQILSARDRLRDYEMYLNQLQATARRQQVDKMSSLQSTVGSLQAKLSVSEKTASQATHELDSLRESIDARINNGNQCAKDELALLESQSKLKLDHKDKEIESLTKELSELKLDHQNQMTSKLEAERMRIKHKMETLEEELLTSRLQYQEKVRQFEQELQSERANNKLARDSYQDTLDSERAKISETISTSKEEEIESLRQERNRSYDRVRTLEAELEFKNQQLQATNDLHSKQVIEEVNKSRSDLEQQLTATENELKKLRRRVDGDTDAASKRHAEAIRLLEQKITNLTLDSNQAAMVADEAQARCESLRHETSNRIQELESELARCTSDLKESEERLVSVAYSQNSSLQQYKDTQSELQTAKARIVSLSEELTHSRMQKGASGDALVQSRKHSSSLGDQLADSLQRIITLEAKMSEKEVELQEVGAKAAMLEGCLAEATASLTEAEIQLRSNADSKMENERSTAAAISRADAQAARASDLELKLAEARSIETTLESHIAEFETRCSEYERTGADSSKTLLSLESEVSELRGELLAIQQVTNVNLEAQSTSATYAEKVTNLANAIEEKEFQNIGMKRRIEELEISYLKSSEKASLAEGRVAELRKSLAAAKIRTPELERANDLQKLQIDKLQEQLSDMRARVDTRTADAQTAIEKAAMIEGRYKEALSRQANLQKQLAEATSSESLLKEKNEASELAISQQRDKTSEQEALVCSLKGALREEGERTSRLEGQLSEMAAEQIHLQESLRIATQRKAELNEQLQLASGEKGVLEARLLSSEDRDKQLEHQLSLAIGAKEQALQSRDRVLELTGELEVQIAEYEARLRGNSQEQGNLGGALLVAKAEIAELRKSAERITQQAAEQLRDYTLSMEKREERACDEVQRMEALWRTSQDESNDLRAQLEQSAITRGSLQGEVEALKSGATVISAERSSAEHERDKALEEVNRLNSRLAVLGSELSELEAKCHGATTFSSELEGMISHLKSDLANSQETAREAKLSLVDQKTASAAERATLEGHINVLAAGLQDLEHQLQVAASRSTGLEDAVKSSEAEALQSVEATSPLVVSDTPADSTS